MGRYHLPPSGSRAFTAFTSVCLRAGEVCYWEERRGGFFKRTFSAALVPRHQFFLFKMSTEKPCQLYNFVIVWHSSAGGWNCSWAENAVDAVAAFDSWLPTVHEFKYVLFLFENQNLNQNSYSFTYPQYFGMKDDEELCLTDEDISGEETEEVEDLFDNEGHEIRPGLFLGSMDAEMNREWLEREGISHILQVAEGLIQTHSKAGQIAYLFKPLADSPEEDIVVHMPQFLEFIDRALTSGGKVLVHCVAGVSRSASVVILYLMIREDLTYSQALDAVLLKRPWVSPNPGFVLQLRLFEKLGKDLKAWRSWRFHFSENREMSMLGNEGVGTALETLSLEGEGSGPQVAIPMGGLVVSLKDVLRKREDCGASPDKVE